MEFKLKLSLTQSLGPKDYTVLPAEMLPTF